MANIIPLKESTGAQFYPQTHEKAVVDSNGVTLASKLANFSAPSYVVAWDGNSTPVVANIPAGVTFTFGGQTYTGTLAASSSTVNKTYLVYDNNGNFDEYITQVSGSTYSWLYLGNTSIDLSDYATKAELNQLERELLIKEVTFWENSSSVAWVTGNIYRGRLDPYQNRYIIISNFPEGVNTVKITRVAIDSTYNLDVYLSSDGTNFVTATNFGTGGGSYICELGQYDRIALLLWDKPSTERAQQEDIVITYDTQVELLSSVDVVDNLSSLQIDVPLSANQGNVLNNKILNILGGEQFYPLTWATGDIKNTDGTFNPNYANQSTDFVTLRSSTLIIHNPSAYSVKTSCYDSSGHYLGYTGDAGVVPPNSTGTPSLHSDTAMVRFTAYDKPAASAVVNISAGYYIEETLLSLRQSVDAICSTFSNPVLAVDNPDPCIVDGDDGYFYVLGTGDLATRKMYRSTNLFEWEESDIPLTTQGIADCYSDLNVSSVNAWAPEIVKIGDKYNLYTSRQASPMIVFQSEHPNFGYEYRGQIITTSNGLSSDNIDACVRYDLDGTLWMFWGSTYGIYRQKLSADGLTLDSEDTRVHVAGKLLSQDNTRATVFEGAYLYRRKGYWYLFVSAGNFNNYTYCLKVGRSATLNGTFVDKEGNNMADGYGSLLLSSASGDILYGPGHNGRIFTDRRNKTYMVYHSYYTGGVSGERYVCLQEIFWDANGWPYFANGGKPQLVNNTETLF